jgi:hypothetical protein
VRQKNIQHAVRYTEWSAERFKSFTSAFYARDEIAPIADVDVWSLLVGRIL